MPVRGVRGAITITVEQAEPADQAEQVLAAVQELLEAILAANPRLQSGDLASAIFSATPDLASVYPAAAARRMGWTAVPLFCTQEMLVEGSAPRCVRVLLHWNTDLPQSEVRHVYLREAARLRPDLTGK